MAQANLNMEQKVYSRDFLVALKDHPASQNVHPCIPTNILAVNKKKQSSYMDHRKDALSPFEDTSNDKKDGETTLLKFVTSSNSVVKNVDEVTDELYRKIRNVLKKLTDNNFLNLVDQLRCYKIDTREKFEEILRLIFDKVLKRPGHAKIYAKFLQEIGIMYNDPKFPPQTNMVMSRNLIINKCRSTFENLALEKSVKMVEIEKEIEECQYHEWHIELTIELQQERIATRSNAIHSIIFIGEIFKLGMLTFKIMQQFMDHLLKHPYEQNIVYFSNLLVNIADHVQLNLHQNLDEYFKQYQEAYAVAKKYNNIDTIAQDMLQHAIEYRKSNSSSSIEAISTDKKNTKMQTTQTCDDSKKHQETGNFNDDHKETLDCLWKLLTSTADELKIELKPDLRECFLRIENNLPTDGINKKIRFMLPNVVPETSTTIEMDLKLTISHPKSPRRDTVQFDCNFVHSQLLRLIKEKNFDELGNWIMDNVGADAQSPMFVQILMLAIFETSIEVDERNSKVLDSTFAMLVQMMQHYVDQDFELQKRCLNTVRDYLLKVVNPNSVTGLFYRIFYKLQDGGSWDEAAKTLFDILRK